MADPNRLFGIDIREWVLRTAAKMEAPTALSDRSRWIQAWRETYRELGGRSLASGDKGCPRAAACGLWHLGRLAPIRRQPVSWPVPRVVQELGRNAAYAVIAADICMERPALSLPETWRAVQQQFHRHAREEATRLEQGQVRVVRALALAGLLASASVELPGT